MAAIKTFFVPNDLLDRYVADGSKDHTKLFRGCTGMVYDIAAFCDADNNHNFRPKIHWVGSLVEAVMFASK